MLFSLNTMRRGKKGLKKREREKEILKLKRTIYDSEVDPSAVSASPSLSLSPSPSPSPFLSPSLSSLFLSPFPYPSSPLSSSSLFLLSFDLLKRRESLLELF